MSDLRQNLRDWRTGLALLGFPVADINWQSIAVLLANTDSDGKEDVRHALTSHDGGWATLGCRTNTWDGGTSLYISPKGMVYWLRHGGHTLLYHDIMGCRQDDMDKAGWLHISGGRVDVRSRMTEAQVRWLDDHKPSPSSEHSRNGDWRVYDPCEHRDMGRDYNSIDAPVAYPKAEPFDVRPVPGFDLDNDDHWQRLMLRIDRAKSSTLQPVTA